MESCVYPRSNALSTGWEILFTRVKRDFREGVFSYSRSREFFSWRYFLDEKLRTIKFLFFNSTKDSWASKSPDSSAGAHFYDERLPGVLDPLLCILTRAKFLPLLFLFNFSLEFLLSIKWEIQTSSSGSNSIHLDVLLSLFTNKWNHQRYLTCIYFIILFFCLCKRTEITKYLSITPKNQFISASSTSRVINRLPKHHAASESCKWWIVHDAGWKKKNQASKVISKTPLIFIPHKTVFFIAILSFPPPPARSLHCEK